MKDLVFLHGGSHGSWCWAPLLAEMDRRPGRFGRVLALDMPGSGAKRGRSVSDETLQSVAAELNSDIRDAGFRDVILIGHSIAGVLLPMMAAADPDLFASLIFLATSVPREGESVMDMMGNTLHGQDPDHVGWPLDPSTPPADMALAMFGPDLTPDQLTWLMAEVARDVTPPAVALQAATHAGYDGTIPSTYIVTLRDPILPAPWQRRFAERARCRTIVEIDTPHEPFVSHPALLADTLQRLVEAVPGQEPRHPSP